MHCICQAKDIESYSSDPAILALAEQFCTSASVSVSNLLQLSNTLIVCEQLEQPLTCIGSQTTYNMRW